MNIGKATLSDIPWMIALDRASPTAAHWNEAQYAELFASARLVLGAWGGRSSGSPDENLGEPNLLGFLVAQRVASEWELENIVVDPGVVRTGIGSQLLACLLDQARGTNSEAVFLEVRESNHAARAFYEKALFRETGRRKSYYNNPLEGAVLYRLVLP